MFKFLGAAIAECANEIIAAAHPDLYPKGGVIGFSKEIAEDLLKRVERDIEHGGTGIFTNDHILHFARQKWIEKKMGHLFPGNLLLVNELGITEGAKISAKSAWKVYQRLQQKSAELELGGPAVGKLYGKRRSEFIDGRKYQWLHLKSNGKHVSVPAGTPHLPASCPCDKD